MIFLLLYNFIRTDDTMICNDINTNSFSDNNLMAGMYTPNKEMLSCRSAGQPDKLPSNIPFINTGSTQGSYTPTSYIQVGQPVYSGTAGTTYTPQQSQYTYSPTSSSYQFSSVPAAQVPLSSPLNINAVQPVNDKKFVSPCDNTDDEDMFKECIKKALKSLRSIINNCKKTLGNVEICCIDDKCLESLKGIPFGKDACEVRKERMCKDECDSQILYGGSKDSCNKHKDDCDGHKDDCDMHTDRCNDDEDKGKKKRRKSKDKKKGKRKRRRHGRRDNEEEEEDDDDSTASYSDEDEYESKSEKRKDKRKKKKDKEDKEDKEKREKIDKSIAIINDFISYLRDKTEEMKEWDAQKKPATTKNQQNNKPTGKPDSNSSTGNELVGKNAVCIDLC